MKVSKNKTTNTQKDKPKEPIIRVPIHDVTLTPEAIRSRLDKIWEDLTSDPEGRTLRDLVISNKKQNMELWELLSYLHYENVKGKSVHHSQNESIDNANAYIRYMNLINYEFSDLDLGEKKWYNTIFFQTIMILIVIGFGVIIYLWYNDQQVLLR